MQDYKEELNNISKTVRGHFINFSSITYDDEINDLINNPGSQEFISNASFKAKAELLAYADHKNLRELISQFKVEDIFDIADNATLDQLRVILNKLIANDVAQQMFFNADFLENIKHLDDEKHFLIKGFLNKINLKNNSKFNEEDLSKFRKDFDKLRSENDYLKSAHKKTIDELNEKIKFLEKENAETIQKRIDDNLSDYVSGSVATLNDIEDKLKKSAGLWSFISVFILILGFSVGIAFSLFGYAFGPDLKELKWPELLIFSLKGIFIVSAFVAAAGYSFMKSNAFTHEAIIVSNRAHAIQFGKLYLEIYGNTVERSEMQKIFENWNISSDTAFLKPKNDKSDPVKFSEFLDSLKKVKELIPSIGKD